MEKLIPLISLIFLLISCGQNSEPDGIYYVGSSYDNCSYISFGPPNEYHSGYITWVGNKRNGTANCKTKGGYSINGNIITVSGFYNPNCSSMSNRNGAWKIDGKNVISPSGVRYRKY
jgi:hypothetical protein